MPQAEATSNPRQSPALLGRLSATAISLTALVVLWALVAVLVDHRHLPGPLTVAARFLSECQNGGLLTHLGATLARVTVSFVLAMVIGTALGLALAANRLVDQLFDSWLIFFLNLPALVVIILCYVWLGLTETAAILAVALNKIPNVAVQMREGARSLSRDLDEMAHIFRFSPIRRMRHVVLPQLTPFLLAAARSGLSLVWKIVLVVELLGRSTGIGHQLQVGFSLFDVSMILAYAIAFIIVVQVIELAVLQPLEAHFLRWRR